MTPAIQRYYLPAIAASDSGAAGAPSSNGGGDCCCMRVIKAVANFFKIVAIAIYDALSWLLDRLCCCLDEDADTDFPGDVDSDISRRVNDMFNAVEDDSDEEPFEPMLPRSYARQGIVYQSVRAPINHGAAPRNYQANQFQASGNFELDSDGFPIIPEEAFEQLAQVAPLEPIAPFVEPARLDNVTPEIQAERVAGIKRIDQIEQGLRAGNIEFEVTDPVLNFDLDAALAPYSKATNPSRLMEMLTYAGKSDLISQLSYDIKKGELSAKLGSYSNGDICPAKQSAKESLSQLFHMFEKKKSSVDQFIGPQNTKDDQLDNLKNEIRDMLAAILDAHENCVDQVTGRLENILTQVVATLLVSKQGETMITILASLGLFRYRSELIKDICIKRYPGYAHLADFERIVKKEMASHANIRSGAVESGAYYANFIPSKARGETGDSDPVNFVCNMFGTKYSMAPLDGNEDCRPQHYLARELETYHGSASLRNLRSRILLKVMDDLDLANAYDDDIDPTAKILIERASGKEQDAFLSGHNLSRAGTLWLMEKYGVIKQHR
jgi:hypothetical protein